MVPTLHDSRGWGSKEGGSWLRKRKGAIHTEKRVSGFAWHGPQTAADRCGPAWRADMTESSRPVLPGNIPLQQWTCHFPGCCMARSGGSGGREAVGEEILLQEETRGAGS